MSDNEIDVPLRYLFSTRHHKQGDEDRIDKFFPTLFALKDILDILRQFTE